MRHSYSILHLANVELDTLAVERLMRISAA